ncbi:MAG TPA: DUF4157 domain-containing protein [Devosia sp.]|jgi:hypothetical protein|uniref:eCIS core domain-containing protein n=1 Tax=Devosia sp. TaxID=1871048 RepID=UPI002DDCC3AD|nr:DUF4157 domain-containing protein [Devosia sp.]HEV2517979.1 DUF4157 domain-containing protein [Devosia sp.]
MAAANPRIAAPAQPATAAAPRRIMPASHPLEQQADRAVAPVLSGARPVPMPQAAGPTSGGAPSPALVNEVLGSRGQPLDGAARALFEPRFGRDFSNVRIHHDAAAQRSAALIGAAAYSSGNHIVFGAGRWQPGLPRGQRLLAHELAHHAMDAGRANGPVWRKEVADIEVFDAGTAKDVDLLAYLKVLRDSGKIEKKGDSKEKARGVVRRWRQGGDAFGLSPDMKVLLIEEMLHGYTANDSERAILTLLQRGARPDLEVILPKVDADRLYKNFQGDELDSLRAFYNQILVGGYKAVFTGKPLVFAPEPVLEVTAPYGAAAMRAVVADIIIQIGLFIRDRNKSKRAGMVDSMIRAEAPRLQAQLSALPSAQQATAVKDLSADRARRDAQADTIWQDIDAAPTQDKKDTLGRRRELLLGEVLLLDLVLQGTARDIAMGAPKVAADYQKLTTPLDAATKKAATDAIAPQTQAAVQAAAKGLPPPPAPVFNPAAVKGSKDTYEDKVKKRVPDIIKEAHARFGAPRDEKAHADKTKARSMDDMQVIANQAKDEVDLVFASFYNKGAVTAFQADKRDAGGKLTAKGNLRDVWQVEQDLRTANPAYEKSSAMFWLYYLIQNDRSTDPTVNANRMAGINEAHDASPSFDKNSAALNDEAKIIRKVGDPLVSSDSKRLFEIGRGWDAYQRGGDIHIQLFKKPTPAEDRRFLWDMYFTLMHEYLHKLKSGPYDTYAQKLGGEHSTQGNTLIEGVDSLLTEIAWSSAIKRTSTKAVREKVEPDAVAAKLPYDANLVPKIPHRRYATYEHAVRLVGVVGLHNLYAAYFQGRVDLIGGP